LFFFNDFLFVCFNSYSLLIIELFDYYLCLFFFKEKEYYFQDFDGLLLHIFAYYTKKKNA
jgi:hypothetical protein